MGGWPGGRVVGFETRDQLKLGLSRSILQTLTNGGPSLMTSSHCGRPDISQKKMYIEYYYNIALSKSENRCFIFAQAQLSTD